jgi:hypothetical protein
MKIIVLISNFNSVSNMHPASQCWPHVGIGCISDVSEIPTVSVFEVE